MRSAYLITPFLAWLFTGVIKFVINSIKGNKLAFEKIGYGGMPSNHTAIVSSIACLIAVKDGIEHPAFGVAIALVFVVVLDAISLRRQIGYHARELNKLTSHRLDRKLRTKLGHTPMEVIAGIASGVTVGVIVGRFV